MFRVLITSEDIAECYKQYYFVPRTGDTLRINNKYYTVIEVTPVEVGPDREGVACLKVRINS